MELVPFPSAVSHSQPDEPGRRQLTPCSNCDVWSFLPECATRHRSVNLEPAACERTRDGGQANLLVGRPNVRQAVAVQCCLSRGGAATALIARRHDVPSVLWCRRRNDLWFRKTMKPPNSQAFGIQGCTQQRPSPGPTDSTFPSPSKTVFSEPSESLRAW
jgi:hypothetical protein